MSESEFIERLMLEWEARRANSGDVSASGLGIDDVELLGKVQSRIDKILCVERLMGITVDNSSSAEILQEQHSVARLPEIDGYDVCEMLDQGGMGIVYRAKQLELQRTVALKMMHEYRLDERHAERFRVEAEAVAKVQHPNIVQIFDSGESNGRPWFSMEYLPGGSLKDYIATGLPDVRESAELALTLAIAVHATHEQGIVHRDLKPSNVLLTNTGMPKLADFGLAKNLESDSDTTRSGEILGTPQYMAPEQAEGKRDRIGPAVDVYAVGVILYELLVGRPPFLGSTTLEALRRITDEDPLFPTEAKRRVPRDLQLICLMCLRKNPGERYVNAALLADDLECFLTGRPINADRVGLARRVFKWGQRRPDLAIATFACVVLLLVTVFMAGDRYRVQTNSRELAVQLAPQAREILKRNCLECHGTDAVDSKLLDILNHDALINSSRSIVVPGVPDDSRLIQRITDGSVPPEEEEERLPRVSEKELQILRSWIAGGAPFFDAESDAHTPPVVPHSEVAAKVRDLFHRKCYECHKYDVARGGIKILNHRLLVTVRKVVVPGLPADSELVHIVTSEADAPSAMPPAGYDRLTTEDVELIKRWIAEGAAPFPKLKQPGTIDNDGI